MLPLKRLPAAYWVVFVAAAVLPIPRATAQTATQVYSEGVDALKQGDIPSAKHKLELALEIDRNYRPASALLNRINAEQRASAMGAPGLSSRALERTVVPVEFKDTTLTSALEILRQRADETTGGKLKINFAVNLPPDLANKRVTLKMDRVPITEVLRYMGELTGVNFEVQQYAIMVTPAPTISTTPSPAVNPTP